MCDLNVMNSSRKDGYLFHVLYFSVTEIRIANHSTEFVNKVLDKVRSGVPDGGIDDF